LLKASAYVGLKDFSRAIPLLDQVLAISPDNQSARLLKASADMEMKDYPGAIQLLDQVLLADPNNIRARLNRGAARRQNGQLTAAWRDFSDVIQTATNAFPAYYNLAEIADQQTNPAAAITNYEMFLKYAPPNVREVAQAEARLKALQPATP